MTDNDGAGSTGSEAGAPASGSAPPPMKGARWADPLMAADRVWTRFEIWLALFALTLEVLAMSLWVSLKGFSAPSDQAAGVVFRAILGGTVLGMASHAALSKQKLGVRRGVTAGAALLGVVTAKAWAKFGVDYSSNLLNWYQQASFLTLLGGLRGVATRLTMLLALLGGSLATGRGKHIVIDVVTRFVSYRPRMVMALVSWAASAVVCLAAAWGFFDHISIENFGARMDDTAGGKIERVIGQLGEDVFIARKQIALDFKAAPHVLLKGEPYSDWLTGKEWNAWVDSAGFAERYGEKAMGALRIPDDSTRAPLVVIPGRGEPRGELISAAYLVFPIGLLIIAVRFIVRGLLAISGHVKVDPDESEEWGEQPQGDQEPLDATPE
jgi:TRAP-type C4-dicarboxylate transport system permease small subunit